MLNGLKLLGIIPGKAISQRIVLLLIVAMELLTLGWLTWLIFQKNPIN
ncbi:MAG TPA: hypothetical protein VK809_11680 [Bacteroidia bacterium]|jgi:hypothetical protein|nr:hypothetical protein [Bacteroidia bacterium]